MLVGSGERVWRELRPCVEFLIALFSGWMTLSRRFRRTSVFMGPAWGLHSARKPLFIPWGEIPVARRRTFLFIRQVKLLLLGQEEQIPFVIGGGLADRIRVAAGASWPIEAVS